MPKGEFLNPARVVATGVVGRFAVEKFGNVLLVGCRVEFTSGGVEQIKIQFLALVRYSSKKIEVFCVVVG